MAERTVLLLDANGAEHRVGLLDDGAVSVNGRVVPVILFQPGEYRAGGCAAWAVADGDLRWVFVAGVTYTFDVRQVGAARARARTLHADALSAPMPATVIKIAVSAGDHVRAGDVLIVLEAMKMELPVRAPANGVVQTVRCTTGELVRPGQDLIVIAAEGT